MFLGNNISKRVGMFLKSLNSVRLIMVDIEYEIPLFPFKGQFKGFGLDSLEKMIKKGVI